LFLAIAAPDASSNSLDKVLPLLRARGITVVAGPSAAELGSVAGREATAVIGIVDKGLAKGILALSLTPMPDGRNEEIG
jgi:ribosomal protein L7Ae-like RNA K-turn-binding protein